MKVAVYYSNNDIRIEERPVPSLRNGEILVKMMSSGICGTDVLEWYRRLKGPRILGHEMAGEVVSVAKGLGEFKIDAVIVSRTDIAPVKHCTAGIMTREASPNS